MKKWVKTVLIVGFMLILTGAGVTAASFAMGADPVRIGNYFGRRFDLWDYGEEVRPEDQWVSFEERQVMPKPQVMPKQQVMPQQQGTAAVGASAGEPEGPTENPGPEDYELIGSYPSVTKLEIDGKGGTMELVASEGGTEFIVLALQANGRSVQYKISEREDKLEIDVHEGEHYRLVVPDGWVFDEIEVEAEGGELTLEIPGGFAEDRIAYSFECKNGTIVLPDGTSLGGRESRDNYISSTDSFLKLEAEEGAVITITK